MKCLQKKKKKTTTLERSEKWAESNTAISSNIFLKLKVRLPLGNDLLELHLDDVLILP